MKLNNHPKLCIYFENRHNQELESMYRGIIICLKTGVELGIRYKIRRSHKPYKLKKAEFDAFLENISDTFKQNNFGNSDANLVIDRLKMFERDIVSAEENDCHI